MKAKTSIAFFVSLFVWSVSSVSYAVEPRDREQFYQLVELINLVQKAKEAGLQDEDLRNMSFKDDRKEIKLQKLVEMMNLLKKKNNVNPDELSTYKIKNAKDVVDAEAFLKKQLEKKKASKRDLRKDYITIQDILDELVEMEPETLTSLRDQFLAGAAP